MDHVVYLDHKAREFEQLADGSKNMIVRGAMGRKMPHGRVHEGDKLYFIRNNGEGHILGSARVADVQHSEKMERDESIQLLESKLPFLGIDARMRKRFAGKRYLVLITINSFETMAPFEIDRSAYGNMDDWLPVGDIDSVKM